MKSICLLLPTSTLLFLSLLLTSVWTSSPPAETPEQAILDLELTENDDLKLILRSHVETELGSVKDEIQWVRQSTSNRTSPWNPDDLSTHNLPE